MQEWRANSAALKLREQMRRKPKCCVTVRPSPWWTSRRATSCC
ncbi:MAG: hypothetical protein R3A10_12180 [Caldilineaceae bacterium]